MKKMNRNLRYVPVGFHRTLLACGLLLVLSGSLACSKFSSVVPFRGDPTVEVQSSAVNIREAATTRSRILSTAKRGEELEVLDKTESWYRIKTKSGTTGWVHGDLVK